MNDRQRKALAKVLNHIAGWTSARFDQHLRYEVGDSDANEILSWLDRSAHIEFDSRDRVFKTREEIDREGRRGES